MLQINFTVLSAGFSHLMNPEVSMNLKDCFGGMISSPSFTYSLVSFSSAAPSMHSASEPDFPERQTSIACLPLPVFKFAA